VPYGIPGQSKTIERFVARQHGFLGSNELEAAQVDMICEHMRDIKQMFVNGRQPPSRYSSLLFVCLSVGLSVCLSVCLCVCLSVRLSVCCRLSLSLSLCLWLSLAIPVFISLRSRSE
jgi:hypothetical protein